jgi:hypothetical protein
MAIATKPEPAKPAHSPDASAASAPASEGPAQIFSDWRLEDELREARRLVRIAQMQAGDEPARLDGDMAEGAGEVTSPAVPASPVQNARGGSNFGWMLAGLGFSGLVCGCALLVWSHVAARAELWSLGLPIALVSQAVLVVGVLLLLDFGAAMQPAPVQSAPATSHLHVHSGGLHASGISVHFSSGSQQSTGDGGQLTRQIEAAMRRAA